MLHESSRVIKNKQTDKQKKKTGKTHSASIHQQKKERLDVLCNMKALQLKRKKTCK